MGRFIDAELLLEDNTWEWFDEWGNYTLAGQSIADAPTVDAVEVVHGEWNICEDDYNDLVYHTCSNCGAEYTTDYGVDLTWKFCPNCGAKMDGGR